MNKTPQASGPRTNEPLWYKDAVIYQLHVKSFFDANNDGIGDFAGLVAKLDYISQLGVTAIWLLPFYPSPRLDDGYDISEYRRIHPDYGSLADVRKLIRLAHDRGLHVITELVINHTSDQHAWFQRARRAKPGSAARNFYVWSDNDQGYPGTRIIFCDTEKSNWTWDPVAGAYFWHRFYSHQPDLNYDNPRVLKEILNIMRFWLDMGVDGLRLDAVPYLVEREGTNNENLPETHAILREIRAVIDAEYPDRMLLAEANQWPEDAQEYFGTGDECHMSFHFPLMPRMYMAIAQADRHPITDILQQTPDIPDNCQWATFLRNHDELTLEMVTSSERDYLWNVYAADRRARINLGIRRRLAPLLERDRRRIELMNSLLLTMPGTPVVYYGDEIGMGDNIHLGDRDGVRTPMQWTADRNGGFSRADPERLSLPVLMDPLYGYEAVNVEAQQRDPHSLLNWTRLMLAKRRQTRAFGRGGLRLLFPGNRKILAYLREHDETVLLCVANLSNAPQPLELDLGFAAGRVPVELLSGTSFPTIGERPYLLTLPPYGFYCFDLNPDASPPSWHAAPSGQASEQATLVVRRRAGAGHPFTSHSERLLSARVLPMYLGQQRWYAGDQAPQSVEIAYLAPVPGSPDAIMAEVEARLAGRQARYFLPLMLHWEDEFDEATQPYALARARRGAETGRIVDACHTPAFARALLAQMQSGQELAIETRSGREFLRFQGEPRLRDMAWSADMAVEWFHGEQSNTTILLGDAAVLKLVRHVHPGVHPDAEMARHLQQAGYRHCAPLLGEVSRIDPQGRSATLALLHGRIDNQGDAWTWIQDYLERVLNTLMPVTDQAPDYHEALLGISTVAAAIGARLGELHTVLAQASDDPAFAPRRATASDARHWARRIRSMLDAAIAAASGPETSADAKEQAAALRTLRPDLAASIRRSAQALRGTWQTRVHGDLHLGQVLIAQSDVYLIDFEGEPLRTLSERRAKTSPWRDVAGILRSFDYAGAAFARAVQTSAEVLAADVQHQQGEAQRPEDGQALAARLSASPPLHRDRLISQFLDDASQAFLHAYRDATDNMQPRPGSPDGDALLHLALIEKCAYEVCYEAAHRPDWLAIPLSALTRLARQAAAATGTPPEDPGHERKP